VVAMEVVMAGAEERGDLHRPRQAVKGEAGRLVKRVPWRRCRCCCACLGVCERECEWPKLVTCVNT